MATTTYSGSAGAAQALNYTVTVALSGGSSISGARIDSVVAAAFMSTNAYTNTYQVRVRLLNSGGGTLAESTQNINFTSSNYGGTTHYFDFGTSVDVNSIASISFFGLNDASKVFVKDSQSVTVSYTTYVACTAPTSVTLSASMAAPGGSVNLSWSGAGAGAANPIVGYIIQRSVNGGTWTSWATDTASPYTVTAHATYGNYYDYRIITDGQYIDSGASASVRLTTYTPTACKAPTTASLDKSVAEVAPTLTYSGAAGGTINAITGYEIQYAESTNNSLWGAWTALKTVTNTATSGTTTVALSATRTYYRKYRIRTQGGAGASYYSGWKETSSVRYNSIPTAPTSFVASPEVYVSGAIALTYSGTTDPDGNLMTHQIQYATKSGVEAWSAWVNLTNGITSHTPTLSPGQSIKYRVRAVDALGAVSSYKESNTCVKNTAPAKPTVNYPQAGKTTYNSRPRLLVTLGADPEGHTQRLVAGGFTPSRAGGLTAGAKIVLRRTNAAGSGTISYSIKSADQYNEESTAATGSLTYSVPSYTDANLTAGTTRIKAAHMNELRTMINNVRKYYGFPEFLAAGTNYIPTIDGDNIDWTIWGSGTTLTKWDATHIYYPASTTITRGIISPEFMINGRSGDVYTLSIETAARSGIANGTKIDYIYLMDPIGGNAFLQQDGEIILSGSVVKRSLRVTLPRDFNNPVKLLIGTNYTQVTAAGDVIIGKVKLEKGVIESDWTEAPTGSYGSWAEAITAGVTKSRGWKTHVIELQQAINDVITLVNSWDTESTVNRIQALNWVTLTEKPNADVMNQLRQVITWL